MTGLLLCCPRCLSCGRRRHSHINRSSVWVCGHPQRGGSGDQNWPPVTARDREPGTLQVDSNCGGSSVIGAEPSPVEPLLSQPEIAPVDIPAHPLPPTACGPNGDAAAPDDNEGGVA
ncbi:hypothetical protein Vafri_17457 [Volvox africanus]|uniref:Uncharacterized protein n=1 Tax=Volvox africanus TaxID=51714 RepID=A0A8J4BQK6_9CHLO|nr:hypothetical protein Vafri_17457 [Volvox africanus]